MPLLKVVSVVFGGPARGLPAASLFDGPLDRLRVRRVIACSNSNELPFVLGAALDISATVEEIAADYKRKRLLNDAQ
jgi:hypothetical protein